MKPALQMPQFLLNWINGSSFKLLPEELIKKSVLLLGSLGALIGLGFVSSQALQTNESNNAGLCEWVDEIDDWYDGCEIQVIARPCIYESC